MITEPILTIEEDRRVKFISACLSLRDVLGSVVGEEEEALTELAKECVETVLLAVGWPLTPPWWDAS